jgi:hypothetical protein
MSVIDKPRNGGKLHACLLDPEADSMGVPLCRDFYRDPKTSFDRNLFLFKKISNNTFIIAFGTF